MVISDPSIERLTPREFDVLRLLSTGATNAQMARVLTLSEGTIRNVIAHVTCKLGLADRTQAALFAYQAGLG
jgi:DNA-binding NarL/FixJ family response regulator